MVKIAIFMIALFLAPQAFACGIMEKADPKVGSTVAATDHLTLYFSETFDPQQSSAAIIDENGAGVHIARQSGSKGNSVLSVVLAKPLTAGKYKVSWNALWLDCGQKTEGDYKFTVR